MNNELSDKAFLKELKELLSKYNASIGFDVSDCSDTHGIYDEKMVISRRADSYTDRDILEIDGWSIDSNDL